MFKLRLAYTIILLQLSLASLAVADDVNFFEARLAQSAEIQDLIRDLRQGDNVLLVRPDGSYFAGQFRLGAYLGGGQMGRVFKLTYPGDFNTVIKFQGGGDEARRFMLMEIQAHRALDAAGIPNSRILRWHASLFVEKEFVPGKTLDQIAEKWPRFSIKERAELLTQLAKLYNKIARSRLLITDLHQGNIMWDENERIWKVTDPGLVTAEGDYRDGLLRMVKGVRDSLPGMSNAFVLSLRNPDWVEPYLTLQNAVEQMKIKASPSNIALFRSLVVQTGVRPDVYNTLVHEGEYFAKVFGTPVIGMGRVTQCVRSFVNLGR